MPLTDRWLESFLQSKFHQDWRAFGIMATAIFSGLRCSKEGKRAAGFYAREAYGAYIVSNPSLKREDTPELLEPDFENLR